jgi:regulator of replication initiation timing
VPLTGSDTPIEEVEMKVLRRALVAAAAVGMLVVPTSAGAAVEKEPDCTWTNDNVAVCKYKDGSKVCYDHYGEKVDCPEEKSTVAPNLGLASR